MTYHSEGCGSSDAFTADTIDSSDVILLPQTEQSSIQMVLKEKKKKKEKKMVASHLKGHVIDSNAVIKRHRQRSQTTFAPAAID